MAEKSVEERLDILEERNKELEHELERVKAVSEIQNVMSRYQWFLSVGLGMKIYELFSKRPDVSGEIGNWGIWDGQEGIMRLYGIGHTRERFSRPGGLTIHTLTNPVIEVAKDGKTAKAIWMSPGVETHLINGELKAHWAWCRYGVDFVKEDRQWKFWHTRIYGLFRTPYDKSWVDKPPSPLDYQGVGMRAERKSDRPSQYYWSYSPVDELDNVPAPPEPYETWDGKSVADITKEIPF